MYVPYKKYTYPNFRLRPILRIKTNSALQCWCSLVSDILKNSRLNQKLKISNTADNAGITQSQARDTNNNNNNPICKAPECQKTSVALTRYRGMQEQNSPDSK